MAVVGYDYLVVGGGMAADQAVRAIREIDACATVGILCADEFPPYDRPPLSKGLWSGAQRLEGVLHHADYAALRINLHLTAEVREVRPAEHLVVTADDVRWPYRKLLLATGCAPRTLPGSVAPPALARSYRTLSDYLGLRRALEAGARRIVMIGGGFIGVELAAVLSVVPDVHVTMLFPEPSLWSGRLPRDLSRFVTGYFAERNVDVAVGEKVRAVTRREDGVLEVRAASGRTFGADLVVTGIGVRPRVSLAADAGLAVADGIVVDAAGRTSAPDIFCAGDVANFPSALGGRTRIEHEDHAHRHGRLAGRNMTGLEERYDHIPMFYSDLFDLGFEAVGRLEAQHTTFADWIEPHRKGVVYYLDEDRHVVGVLLWNVWEQVEPARVLVREHRRWSDLHDLAGRIRS